MVLVSVPFAFLRKGDRLELDPHVLLSTLVPHMCACLVGSRPLRNVAVSLGIGGGDIVDEIVLIIVLFGRVCESSDEVEV